MALFIVQVLLYAESLRSSQRKIWYLKHDSCTIW